MPCAKRQGFTLAIRSTGELSLKPTKRPGDPFTLIDVETFLREHSVEELCETAEAYYARLPAEELLVHDARKPFGNLLECSQTLHKLGLLFAGLRLGQGMTVMDFGAGLGWLSRHLNQLGCETVAVDVSETALRLGRQAFERLDVGERKAPAHFVRFDGRKLDWPDATVDRVVCFDALHHVPNPGEVLAEMSRVLRPGGIAGFAEPGRHHSRTAPAQMEMERTVTLENDVRVEDLFELARRAGFTDVACQQGVHQGTMFSLGEYLRIAAPEQGLGKLKGLRAWWRRRALPRSLRHKVQDTVRRGLVEGPVFFFHKGPFQPDSRSPEGLSHALELGSIPASVAAGDTLEVDVTVTNTGTARWLAEGRDMIGVVHLAVHRVDSESRNAACDIYRLPLGRDVAPGERLELRARVPLTQAGLKMLRFDLVAEQVAWFERLGSRPVEIEIAVV